MSIQAKVKVQASWDRIWTDRRYLFRPVSLKNDTISVLLARALKTIEKSSGIFLDVGSGPGSRTIPLVGKLGKFRLMLLDNSPKALFEGARYASAKKVKAYFVKGDAFRIPFDSNSIACTFSNGLNEHFDGRDRQELFNEMARVTRRGGVVVIIVPNKLNPFHSLNKMVREKKGSWIYGPQYDFTPSELIRCMEKAGLRHIEEFGAGAFTSWIRLFAREKQQRLVSYPTPFKILNRALHNLDMKVDSAINKKFGREIMVIGKKS